MAKQIWYSITLSMFPGNFLANLCIPSCHNVFLFRCSSLLSGNSSISPMGFKLLWCNNGGKATVSVLFLTSAHSHMLCLLCLEYLNFSLHLNNSYLYLKFNTSIIPSGKHFYINNNIPIFYSQFCTYKLLMFTCITQTVIIGLLHIDCTSM